MHFDWTMLYSNFHVVFHVQSILIIATNTIDTNVWTFFVNSTTLCSSTFWKPMLSCTWEDWTMLCTNFHLIFHKQSILIIVTNKIVTRMCEHCFSIQEYCVVLISETLCFHVLGKIIWASIIGACNYNIIESWSWFDMVHNTPVIPGKLLDFWIFFPEAWKTPWKFDFGINSWKTPSIYPLILVVGLKTFLDHIFTWNAVCNYMYISRKKKRLRKFCSLHKL